ncbi:MAG: aminotransferase class III-fold pyridoxal phosphate-dependent enzyme [Deltaproteobacteria bacterium]|nr:aminotransferase class III-fold pyridoxal phosphate-dependent enzyme [Deltaproteobacteria bacterium]MBW2050701.1 aminotransferase class III-fold pyridoxal phosphate-dependent enzyme [Deltaproteobacteria bacterium]MBW2141437.1 aminotransferase class III-fold pyridoxal phosphate-dependent enzyme [Deltaproteobacteria bacterium]MBW2322487.1 aminotransferase class III-fold pyridoxal phosphate-dependent enzyme [Deltaproteobacteria bacterium]
MEYEEIISRLRHIATSPVHPIPDEKLEKVRQEYYEKHSKSLQLFNDAQDVIPGGVEHNLSSSHPFPLAMDRAKGYKLWDVDGNEFVDYLLCGGPIMLGHHFDELDDRIVEVINEKGPATGLSCEYEILAAKEIIKRLPGVETVRFLQSGTEGCMAAIRIARAFTGKDTVIKVGGSYHGWSDQMVYSIHIPGTGALQSAGISKDCFNHIVDVAPNDFEGLEKAFKENQDNGGVAAMIVEPIGGECGTHPVHPEWNKTIRGLCDTYGALLIFDEVVTAFRLHMGGAQTYFNIKPDLTVLGKIITHGYPSCGAVAGRKDVMSVCHADLGKRAYLGGTLAANPISTAACYHALKLMEKYDALKKAADYADKLTKGLNDLFSTRDDLPFFVYNYGPILHYATTSFFAVKLTDPDFLNQILLRRKVAEDYQMAATLQGLSTLAGTRMYTCMQHDQEALDKTIQAWEYVLSLIPKS